MQHAPDKDPADAAQSMLGKEIDRWEVYYLSQGEATTQSFISRQKRLEWLWGIISGNEKFIGARKALKKMKTEKRNSGLEQEQK